MSAPGNEVVRELDFGAADPFVDLERFCRNEDCRIDGIHLWGPGCKIGREAGVRCKPEFRTRSRRYAAAPWKAGYTPALRESVLAAVSKWEPRTFGMVVSHVENDYGSCCPRSVHRHLLALREIGEIIRLDFPHRIHAYLARGSRLVNEPDVVFDQILDTYSSKAA
jgi:hypothetical protein